jgi:PAS domain S-box-containing protein
MKFATKLLVLNGIFLAVGAAMVFSFGHAAIGSLEAQIIGRLEERAFHAVGNLDRYFYERYLETRELAADPTLGSGTAVPQRLAEVLREFLRWHPEYRSASLFSLDRTRLADSAGRRVGERDAPGGFWVDIAAGGEFASGAQPDDPGGEPVIHLAAVVKDGRGAPRGLVVTRMALGAFDPLLRGIPGTDGSFSVDLVDRSGTVLYSSYNPRGVLRESSPVWAQVQERLSQGRSYGHLRHTNPRENIGEEFLFFVREPGFRDYPGSGWTLNVFTPARAALAPALALRNEMVAGILVVGGVLLFVMRFSVRAFTRPIAELSSAATQVGEGDLELRVAARSSDELGLLGRAFNRMVAELSASHRALAAHASELESRVQERTAELLQSNALLHAELSERVKAQAALESRGRLLRLNADVGEALMIERGLSPVLQRCAEHIVTNLDAAFARIWTLGAEEGFLELRASAGAYTRLDGQHSRKIIGELKIGIIAREQRPLLTNAVIGDPAITDQEWARREGMVAFAGNPLIVDGKTVGVMALFSRRPLDQFVSSALAIVADKIAAFVGRKRAEEALRLSENRYRELFDASTDGVYAVNAEGVFTSMNQAGAAIFGFQSPDEIIGRHALEFWRDPRDREAFRAVLKQQKSVSSYRMHALKRSGEHLELESSSRILEDEHGVFQGIEGMLRDVTGRVRAEEERELLIAQLQEAAASIKTLSGLLPICAGCKKIRDERGSWSQIEVYVGSHTSATFSHGLCPDCMKVYFPGTTTAGTGSGGGA